MPERIVKALTPTKAGAAATASTIGVGGSIAFLVLGIPVWAGLFEWPGAAVPHLTAVIIAVWNRTGGRWLLG